MVHLGTTDSSLYQNNFPPVNTMEKLSDKQGLVRNCPYASVITIF